MERGDGAGVNLAAGGRAPAGMSRAQREAHARLDTLPKRQHFQKRRDPLDGVRAANADRAGTPRAKAGSRGVAFSIDLTAKAFKRVAKNRGPGIQLEGSRPPAPPKPSPQQKAAKDAFMRKGKA